MRRSLPAVMVIAVLVLSFVCVALIVALGNGRSGSTSAEPPAVQHPEDAGAREQGDPALREFYEQELAWSPCGDYDCARLEVPLDYAHPTGKRIELAVLRNNADVPSARAGDLVVNPGGPGAGGTWYAERDPLLEPYFGEAIYDRFDVIGFDPRGTGDSAPVNCLTDGELDAWIASDPEPDNPAEEAAYVADAKRFGDACLQRSGAVARHVSTHEAARDMDVLRAALGDAKLNYLGTSYGTKLGATYADLFPSRAGRMVLDAAVDPQLPSRESSLQQAHGFEVALTAYVDHCVARSSCFLGATREAALARIRELMDAIDARPLAVGSRELTSGTAFYGLIQPLYSRSLWPYLDDALTEALAGDGSGLLEWSDRYNSRNADGTYADNGSEAILAINCLDDPSSIPAAEVPAQFADFEKASPTFGRAFAWGLTACAAYAERGFAEPDWKLDAPGADPIIVIGTSRDPATPVQWARALASQLDSGVLITRDGDGHGGYHENNVCVDEPVERYLITGVAPKADLTC